LVVVVAVAEGMVMVVVGVGAVLRARVLHHHQNLLLADLKYSVV